MLRALKPLLSVAVLVVLLTPSEVAAQPGAATSLAGNQTKSVTISWTAVAGATWYYVWINDTLATRYLRWHTDAEVNCGPGQNSTCQINLELSVLSGALTWWVQTWGPGGYGPWSAANTTVVGPLYAVVGSDGALNRGNAISAARTSLGGYEVIFPRDVTTCAFVAAVGTLTTGSTDGFVSTARRLGNVNGVFVQARDAAGALADRSFHLDVICRD